MVAALGLHLSRPSAGERIGWTSSRQLTYASLSLAAGVSPFELSRLMGTSPNQLLDTYDVTPRRRRKEEHDERRR